MNDAKTARIERGELRPGHLKATKPASQGLYTVIAAR